MTDIDPATAEPTAEPTGSSLIARFLAPGEQFHGQPLGPNQGGIELWDGATYVDHRDELVAFAHALLNHFDPPDAATVDAAGLNADDRPCTWKQVALAALSVPATVYIAETTTSHYDWIGTGHTEDEARDALMRAWLAHADDTGADPEYIKRDDLNVRHGVIGTSWRDFDAFLPPPRA